MANAYTMPGSLQEEYEDHKCMHNNNALTEVKDPAAWSHGEKHVLEEKREGAHESNHLIPWVDGVGDHRHHH